MKLEYTYFTDVKPMVYSKYCEDTNTSTVLAYNKKNDIEYLIMNIRGTHPACYIKLPIGVDWENKVTCHGGVTYQSQQNPYSRESGDICENGYIWIGWDYAHCDDYMPPSRTLEMFGYNTLNEFNRSGKKYTIDELLDDVIIAIGSVSSILKTLKT